MAIDWEASLGDRAATGVKSDCLSRAMMRLLEH